MTDKPLHVQVAEALGWIGLRQWNGMDRYSWTGWHAPMEVGKREDVPDFEHDWSATGPLIEKYKITLIALLDQETGWEAESPDWPGDSAHYGRLGPTPLLAVCNLILVLKEAGKLTP